eukprot:scaffold422972_cov62-Attheya_sp.AAC.1
MAPVERRRHCQEYFSYLATGSVTGKVARESPLVEIRSHSQAGSGSEWLRPASSLHGIVAKISNLSQLRTCPS